MRLYIDISILNSIDFIINVIYVSQYVNRRLSDITHIINSVTTGDCFNCDCDCGNDFLFLVIVFSVKVTHITKIAQKILSL